MATPGVKGIKTVSNNPVEVAATLGIEAARLTIISEVKKVMNTYAISIDTRHLSLLSDYMTRTGRLHGITRHVLAKVKESVLMLASFEETTKHLIEGAYKGKTDDIKTVSEAIIMGCPIKIGSGLLDLKPSYIKSKAIVNVRRNSLFEDKIMHVKGLC